MTLSFTSKVYKYIIFFLIGIILSISIYAYVKIKSLENEITDMQLLYSEEKKKIRDDAQKKIDLQINKSNQKFDSILAIKPSIEYRYYEKPVFVNRNLDTALDIHAKHKSDTEATRKNQ